MKIALEALLLLLCYCCVYTDRDSLLRFITATSLITELVYNQVIFCSLFRDITLQQQLNIKCTGLEDNFGDRIFFLQGKLHNQE